MTERGSQDFLRRSYTWRRRVKHHIIERERNRETLYAQCATQTHGILWWNARWRRRIQLRRGQGNATGRGPALTISGLRQLLHAARTPFVGGIYKSSAAAGSFSTGSVIFC